MLLHVLDRGDHSVPPLPWDPAGLEKAARAPRTRSRRPAADPSLNAAGRSASIEDGADRLERESAALAKEVQRLRARASQQDESLARLADALCALRSDRQELHAENRKLRLALRESHRPSSRAVRVRIA